MHCQITIIGNLGRDPENKTSAGGVPWATLSVATTRRAKRGEAYENVTEWHSVKVFGREAEWLGRDAHKGSQVYAVGHIETERWTAKDGTVKQRQVIVAATARVLGPRGSAANSDAPHVDLGGGAIDDIPF
jgi:single-strand DNA-binding protein